MRLSLYSLLCITAIAALFFVDQVSTIFFILIVEVILVFGAVELLHRSMPLHIREARNDNCRRIDGSISARRLSHERSALNKAKSDLLAVLLLIALTGNWLAFFVHYQVIPIPIAASAASEFDVDKENWKQNLRNAGVDEAFEQWSVQRAHVDQSVLESQQQVLWFIWPWIILVLIGWAVGSVVFLRRAYFLIIQSYARGVSNRAEQNVNRDIGRLQEGVARDHYPERSLGSGMRQAFRDGGEPAK